MNKSELVASIAAETGVTKKDTELVIKAFTENVMKTVAFCEHFVKTPNL